MGRAWPGEPLPEGAASTGDRSPSARRAASCPSRAARERWARRRASATASAWGCGLVKGIGEEHEERLDAELRARPVPLAGRCRRRGPGWPRRSSSGSIRVGGARLARAARGASCCGSSARWPARRAAAARRRVAARRAAGRPLDLRLPPTDAPDLPPPTELERLGDAYAVLVARRPTPGGGAVPAGARAAGRGARTRRSRSAGRAGSGSAGWSSPASTR